MNVDERAAIHAALGDSVRLRIVDELALSDRSFLELADLVVLPSNAAAHHLEVLEAAGLIERRVSEGDHRRRYIVLRPDRLQSIGLLRPDPPANVLFVCTHNSARSQFAAALWNLRTGTGAESAGTSPADRVHPLALEVAGEFGVDLSGARPKDVRSVENTPDLIVSVCDRAREFGLPAADRSIHWSIPDPVIAGTAVAFRDAFRELASRLDRLAGGPARPATA
jgi:protein-tyrosine-phosphatase